MLNRMKVIARYLRSLGRRNGAKLGAHLEGPLRQAPSAIASAIKPLIVLGVIGSVGYLVYTHPPVEHIDSGEVGIRINQFTGSSTELRAGSAFVIPGVHRVKRYSLRDQLYRPVHSSKADGEAPFQSLEGLSLGVDLSVRYALDPTRITHIARQLPADIGAEVVEPEVQGVIYRTFTRYSVRDIYSSRRAEIQNSIEADVKKRLAAHGIIVRSVLMGQVDLPADYRAGLDGLRAAELATEKMRYTLELKAKQVRETELESQAEAVSREKAAEAAGNIQVIAAKAQAEAMKHVLPFKEKQIQQRQLEAEAEKITRIKNAEANAEARKIEASGEATSRQRLAEADAYRVEVMGKASSEQLARESALIEKNPLLIQKTLADKLSDKISVIIAPPAADGGFIGSGLLGKMPVRQ